MQTITFSVEDQAGWLREEEIRKEMADSAAILEKAKQGEKIYSDSLGWLDPQVWAGEIWLDRYEELARQVRQQADVLVVVGIGGSNQAARAVVDAIGEQNGLQIVWAGNSLSAFSIRQVLEQLEGKQVYVDVIAKNFETLEPGLAFRVLREHLRKQYGASYGERVICTGTRGSAFETLARNQGYHFLPFPENIGGRFTALSPVGLFPLACAGLDIRAMAEGARETHQWLMGLEAPVNPALQYAVIRNQLLRKGFRMEMLSYFEPRLFRFSRWWMQLFGESEGKEGMGLYPVTGCFSEDLHSIGQFLQEGTAVIFESFLEVEHSGASWTLRDDQVEDGFHYLDGMDVDQVNRAACRATIAAHSSRFPCIRLNVPAIDEHSFGALFYFFQFTCYLSARILGVNPFDQPGVEAYKKEMFRELGK